MNIPLPNPNQFVQPVEKPTQQGMDNFVSNIAALQDPSGTIQRLQAEQIAKASANVKTEGITDQYKQYALNAIQEYQDKAAKMYQGNKGFNRLNLNGQQMLEDNKNYKDLLININSLKDLTADYNKTLEQVHGDVAKGIITAEDYDAFEKAYNDKIKAAKGIGDLPIARSVYNNYLRNKPVPYDPAKEQAFNDRMMKRYKDVNYTEGGTKGRSVSSVRQNWENLYPSGSAQWQNLDAELTGRRFYPPNVQTEEDKKQFLTKASITGYNPTEGRSTTNNYNNFGVKNPVQVNYVKDNGKTVWDFPKKDIAMTHKGVAGYLTGVFYDNWDKKWKGEFSQDKMIVNPNAGFSLMDTRMTKDRNGNDVYEVELDASDYAKVEAAGYKLEDGGSYNWQGLGGQRERTSKKKTGSGKSDTKQTEAQKLGI